MAENTVFLSSRTN